MKLCARKVKIRKKAIYYSKEPRREKLDANLLLIEILHCNFCYTFIKYAIINYYHKSKAIDLPIYKISILILILNLFII